MRRNISIIILKFYKLINKKNAIKYGLLLSKIK